MKISNCCCCCFRPRDPSDHFVYERKPSLTSSQQVWVIRIIRSLNRTICACFSCSRKPQESSNERYWAEEQLQAQAALA